MYRDGEFHHSILFGYFVVMGNISIYLSSTPWNLQPNSQLDTWKPVFQDSISGKRKSLVGAFWKEYGFVGWVRKLELRISFEPFLKPFESDLWIVLFLVSVVVAGVSWILLRKNGVESPTLPRWSSSIFVWNNPSVRARSWEIQKNTKLHVITPIVFMAVILVSGYKGLLITHLIAPFPLPESKSISEVLEAGYKFIPNDKDWRDPTSPALYGTQPVTNDVILYRDNDILNHICRHEFPEESLPQGHLIPNVTSPVRWGHNQKLR